VGRSTSASDGYRFGVPTSDRNDQRTHELVRLEEEGWQALSTDGAAAAAFYRDTLDTAVVMLLPGGMVLDDRDTIINSMSGAPWSTFRIENPGVLAPTPDVGVVTYAVVAQRADAEYSALISSMYVRRAAGWKLAFHQQTPR
jgi:hypothetical protein